MGTRRGVFYSFVVRKVLYHFRGAYARTRVDCGVCYCFLHLYHTHMTFKDATRTLFLHVIAGECAICKTCDAILHEALLFMLWWHSHPVTGIIKRISSENYAVAFSQFQIEIVWGKNNVAYGAEWLFRNRFQNDSNIHNNSSDDQKLHTTMRLNDLIHSFSKLILCFLKIFVLHLHFGSVKWKLKTKSAWINRLDVK